MLDATVAPQVGFIRPFGTTACNVNHSNAAAQPRLKAGAERTLYGVGCTRFVRCSTAVEERPMGFLAQEPRPYGQSRGVMPFSCAYFAAAASTSGRTSA